MIFNPLLLPTKVNKSDGQDLVATSAVNFYENLTQQEVEAFYNTLKEKDAEKQKTTKNANSDTPYNETSDTPIYGPPSYGLNSTLVKRGTTIIEDTWRIGGRYGKTLERIVHWLTQAMDHAESNHQRKVIALLIDYYRTGNLQTFNQYCIQWVADHSAVDFINGFIEVYDDPLGMRGTWEGLVEYIDTKGTERTQIISSNAQWFEDHSPVDPRFKKSQVSGVSAAVICAAMLAGAEYPATAIGINLPNADWIRAQHGSKSITISNIINAYNEASRNSGFQDEFVIDSATKALIARYGDITDTLHTDLHECLGHGSGQLLPGIDPDALKAYGNTIEEARADLFALYYLADPKLTDLGLTPDHQAYQAAYYSYILNGMLTQLARIAPGNNIEEAHMRNRALIARWCYAQGKNRTKNSDNSKHTSECPNGSDNSKRTIGCPDGSESSKNTPESPTPDVIELVTRNNKTYVQINDYEQLRTLFATLLAEIQRIKSCGDYEAARQLVERYAVTVPTDLHNEILTRYNQLGIPPYKGFINPTLTPLYDHHGNITDIIPTYNETYAQQMLRYSRDYSTEAV